MQYIPVHLLAQLLPMEVHRPHGLSQSSKPFFQFMFERLDQKQIYKLQNISLFKYTSASFDKMRKRQTKLVNGHHIIYYLLNIDYQVFRANALFLSVNYGIQCMDDFRLFAFLSPNQSTISSSTAVPGSCQFENFFRNRI